jgi:hypothetical protein
MTSLVDKDIATFEGDQDELAIAPIKFCNEHYDQLQASMVKSAVPKSSELRISHGLFSLAARTAGTEVLMQYGCPICMFEQFSFIDAMVEVFADPPSADLPPQPAASKIILS